MFLDFKWLSKEVDLMKNLLKNYIEQSPQQISKLTAKLLKLNSVVLIQKEESKTME